MAYEKVAERYNKVMIGSLLMILLLLHWAFYDARPMLSILFHLSLAGTALALVTLKPAEGIRQQNIKDIKTNVVGAVLKLMEAKETRKIEELTCCYDCLIVRPKQASHCQKCGLCVTKR